MFKNKKARHCRALKSKQHEGLPRGFAEPSKSSQKERAETTQRENARFGHGSDSGGEIVEADSRLHANPCARSVPLPELIKTGTNSGRAMQQKTPGFTRAKV